MPAVEARSFDVIGIHHVQRQRLEVAGAPVTDEALLEGWRRLHTADPFGNRIELIETLSQAPGDA
jgi:hypothetical protein